MLAALRGDKHWVDGFRLEVTPKIGVTRLLRLHHLDPPVASDVFVVVAAFTCWSNHVIISYNVCSIDSRAA